MILWEKIKYLLAKLLLKIQIPTIIKSDIPNTAKVCSKSHIYNSQINAYSYVENDCKGFNTTIGKFSSILDCAFLEVRRILLWGGFQLG